jgi:hypothetical protein
MHFNGNANEKFGVSVILRLINICVLEKVDTFLCKFDVGMWWWGGAGGVGWVGAVILVLYFFRRSDTGKIFQIPHEVWMNVSNLFVSVLLG